MDQVTLVYERIAKNVVRTVASEFKTDSFFDDAGR
jgi:hypothetical protein